MSKVNFPQLAQAASLKTPKNKGAQFHHAHGKSDSITTLITGGIELSASALSNFTPEQMAMFRIEQARAQAMENNFYSRQQRQEHSSNVIPQGPRFYLKHRTHDNRTTGLSSGCFHQPRVTTSWKAAEAPQPASQTSKGCMNAAPSLEVKEYIHDTSSEEAPPVSVFQASLPTVAITTLDSASVADDLVSVNSDATWQPRWTKKPFSTQQYTRYAVKQLKDEQSRKSLVRARAAARRDANAQRHQRILDQRQQAAIATSCRHERRQAARLRSERYQNLGIVVAKIGCFLLWAQLASDCRKAQRLKALKTGAARRITRWIEAQLELKLSTRASQQSLIVTMFMKRFALKCRRQKKRKLAMVIVDFFSGVKRYGSRTRLLIQSKRYFAAVSIIAAAWRKLRFTVDCEQQMLSLLWAKHEQKLLHPVYAGLSRKDQRTSIGTQEVLENMAEETMALYDTGLSRGELCRLGVATPKCIVSRMVRRQMFYLRHEFRDCMQYHKRVLTLMQGFLQTKRRQLEMAQRLGFSGRPSAFEFDESAIEQFIPAAPEPFRALLSSKVVHELIAHTRQHLDKLVANADSWFLFQGRKQHSQPHSVV
jgi:hypothetical protein